MKNLLWLYLSDRSLPRLILLSKNVQERSQLAGIEWVAKQAEVVMPRASVRWIVGVWWTVATVVGVAMAMAVNPALL